MDRSFDPASKLGTAQSHKLDASGHFGAQRLFAHRRPAWKTRQSRNRSENPHRTNPFAKSQGLSLGANAIASFGRDRKTDATRGSQTEMAVWIRPCRSKASGRR